jgi:hypothetical protein
MRAFVYERPSDVSSAIAIVGADPEAAFLAGGTIQLDLMKDEIWAPGRLDSPRGGNNWRAVPPGLMLTEVNACM